MTMQQLIKIHTLFLEILTTGHLEDRFDYAVEDLQMAYDLDLKQAVYLYNLIRNAMNA